MRKIPFLSWEKVEQIQRERIRAIIAHAYGSVPYYRSTLDRLGLKPSDFQSAQDLAKLPLLSKETVLGNPRLFTSTSIDQSRCVVLRSSGTTGLQAGIMHDHDALLLNLAAAGREVEIFSRKAGISLSRLRVVSLVAPSGLTNTLQRFYRSRTFIPLKQVFISIHEPLDKTLSCINRFRPHIVMGYGSYVGMLFRFALERRIALHKPKVVVYVSDSLPKHNQLLIESEFGISVFSCYGSAEAPRIGFTCERQNGFHIHSDLCHVAIAGNRGREGEIVVSNLTNRAMVLLNYRLGDVVSLGNGPCSCGRSLPLISEVVGRSDDIISLPDGRCINPFRIYEFFRSRMDVLDFQFLRYDNEYVVKIVPSEAASSDQTERELEDKCRMLVGEETRIIIERVKSIRPLENGKVKRVRDLSGNAPVLCGK